MRICKLVNEKLPIGIRKFVNGYCMRNCLEVLKNSSMRKCLEVLENSSMRNYLEILENSSMGTT